MQFLKSTFLKISYATGDDNTVTDIPQFAVSSIREWTIKIQLIF